MVHFRQAQECRMQPDGSFLWDQPPLAYHKPVGKSHRASPEPPTTPAIPQHSAWSFPKTADAPMAAEAAASNAPTRGDVALSPRELWSCWQAATANPRCDTFATTEDLATGARRAAMDKTRDMVIAEEAGMLGWNRLLIFYLYLTKG